MWHKTANGLQRSFEIDGDAITIDLLVVDEAFFADYGTPSERDRVLSVAVRHGPMFELSFSRSGNDSKRSLTIFRRIVAAAIDAMELPDIRSIYFTASDPKLAAIYLLASQRECLKRGYHYAELDLENYAIALVVFKTILSESPD
jgi:site-specific DNA-cytosine methylase